MSAGMRTGGPQVRARAGAAGLAVLLLAACGGGGGPGPGDGQSPDPVVLDIPIAYVKRPLPVDAGGALRSSDLRRMRSFDVGAELWVRERASPSAAENNVTAAITEGSGLYDIRDLEPSWDGRRLLFAMRGPFVPGAAEEDQPTWNIWVYDLDADSLRRVIATDLTAEAGHDVAPAWLPDGRIVFSSTRQRTGRAVLLDEGKPQFEAQEEERREPAFVLHVMNDDGSDIRQVSFNQSHDLDAAVLANGQLVFTRWDRAGTRSGMRLYRMNPDGTSLELLYGANSHATGTGGATVQFSAPRELADGRVLALVRPFESARRGGDLVLIDQANFVEILQPLADVAGSLAGPGQERAVVNEVRTDGSISPGGEFASAWPLLDGTDRVFVSWSPCRVYSEDQRIVPCTEALLADPQATEPPPLYGLWLFDLAADTQLPVFQAEEGVMISDVVAAQPRSLPPIVYDLGAGGADPGLLAEGAGLIDIRSVYDRDGVATRDIALTADPAQTVADERPARFLRLEKAVALPDRTVADFPASAFGVNASQRMREIIGYVPVEPDGSVVAKVPANVPLAVSVLDRDGRRITPRHQNWLQVRPGQRLTCNGCHQPDGVQSHGRSEAFDSAWPGAPGDGQPFPNAVNSVVPGPGETMAQAKARVSCETDCALITPSMDVVYEDVWTNEAAAGRAPDAPFAYRYADLETPAPATPACLLEWSPLCRAAIHYEEHVHPLWSLPRQLLDMDGVTVLEDRTCVACHSVTDDMGAARVPAGQLDLGDGPSDLNADHFKAYREILSPDNEQELVDGALRDVLVETGTDPVTGDPVYAPVPVSAPMSAAGANASATFFSRFAQGGSHAEWLSPAELRLLAEWLDIGAQYWNDPFAALPD